MLNWTVASRKRILVVGLACWVVVGIIAVFNPLKPGIIATTTATWPLWLGVLLALVAVALQFGSWAAAVIIPITVFALIAYGEPWREEAPGDRRAIVTSRRADASNARDDWIAFADTRVPARGAAVAVRKAHANLALEATLEKTHVNPRRTAKKGRTP